MNTDKIFAEAIANEYAPKDTSKVVALRKLDRKAKNPANIFAYSFGVLMTLVLGLGMCLSMGTIGGGGVLMTGVGILLGILGIIGVGLNYPIYKKLLRSGKEKYAFEIMQLAREISEAAEYHRILCAAKRQTGAITEKSTWGRWRFAIGPMCFFRFYGLDSSFDRQPQLAPIGRPAIKLRFSPMGGGDLGHQPQTGTVGGPAVRLQWPGCIRLHGSGHGAALHP